MPIILMANPWITIDNPGNETGMAGFGLFMELINTIKFKSIELKSRI
jgi:hypothetical protein